MAKTNPLGPILKIKEKINPQKLLIEVTQDKKKLLVAIIFLALFLYLDLSFGLGFQMRALKGINPKIVNLRKGIGNLNADLARMKNQGEGEPVVTQQKNLVSPGQLSRLMEEISRLAKQQKVTISQIKPVREGPVTQGSTVQGTLKPKASQPEKYSPVLIDLQASAKYHDLGRFLADLENHSILLQIEELDIKSEEKNMFEHRISLKLKTYTDE